MAEQPQQQPVSRWSVVGLTVALVAGIGLRLHAPSALWLDEAISASISSLPLTDIPHALRQDGAPPLYPFLLWGWERVFGDGADAVRALSSVFGIACIGLAALCGRRLGGRAGAAAAAVLMATSPFAVYYSTEARMYSLVVLLVLLGFLVLDRYLARPVATRGIQVSVVSGLLALTHYWSLFLLLALAASLLVRMRDRRDLLAVGWLAGGGLLFLPWLPDFLFQQAHTGTPWGRPAPMSTVLSAIVEWCGAARSPAPLLALLLAVLAGAGAFADRVSGHRLELDLRGVAPGSGLAVVGLLTLVLGLAIGEVTGAAFAPRYTSVAFPLLVLVAALGASRLPAAVRPAFLVVAASLGIAGAIPQVAYPTKTQAPVLAKALRSQAHHGDVVVYCPDQLGPDTTRLLPLWLTQEVYPTGGSPARVDWVDYARRNHAADPTGFARAVSKRAGRRVVWLVSQDGYRTYEGQCPALVRWLTALRGLPTVVVESDNAYFEHASLRGWAAAPHGT